jgi:FixJ family two-component response regulator
MTGPKGSASVVVHVVDDDESSRLAASRLLKTVGHEVRAYASAAAFLAQPPAGAGCLVLDLRMPGQGGLELQQELSRLENPLPIVFLTGHGDIAKSVRAMKAGAIDFLTKPVEPHVLIEAVARALARDAEDRAVRARQRDIQERFNRLTPREREVFAHLISGQLNKQIGFDLGITERTIKVHRHQVLTKMEANSVADLVRMAEDLGIGPAGAVG